MCVSALRYFLGTTSAGDWVESGPMTSLVVGEAIRDLAFTNGYWTLFNLLPILPLDGGQVLRDVLGPRLLGMARTVGGIWALQIGQPYIALFLGYLAFANFRGDTRALPGGTSN